jgi:hypothetical protein
MPSAHALTDHREIRSWAEARGGRPACVKGTGRKGDTGMIRLDFPGYSGGDSLQSISWDSWFKSFDDNKLALLVQDTTARGEQSHFNKLVARRTAEGKQQSRRHGSQRTRTSAPRRSASGGRRASSTRASSKSRRSKSGRSRSVARQSTSAEQRESSADRSSRRKTSGGRSKTRGSAGGSRRSRNR